jgi:hypothetical protein
MFNNYVSMPVIFCNTNFCLLILKPKIVVSARMWREKYLFYNMHTFSNSFKNGVLYEMKKVCQHLRRPYNIFLWRYHSNRYPILKSNNRKNTPKKFGGEENCTLADKLCVGGKRMQKNVLQIIGCVWCTTRKNPLPPSKMIWSSLA